MLSRGITARFFPHSGQDTPSTQGVEDRYANQAITEDDHGKVLRFMASFTQTFARGLRPGFFITLWNSGTPVSPLSVPLSLNAGGQTLDGLTGYTMYSGEVRGIWVDERDNQMYSTVLQGGTFIDYTTTGAQTGVWPPGYRYVLGDSMGSGAGGGGGGGGGSGQTNNATGRSGGGGGGGGAGNSGSRTTFEIPYELVTPGQTFAYSNSAGGAGGTAGSGGAAAVNTGGNDGTDGGAGSAGGATTFTYGNLNVSATGGTATGNAGGDRGKGATTGAAAGGSRGTDVRAGSVGSQVLTWTNPLGSSGSAGVTNTSGGNQPGSAGGDGGATNWSAFFNTSAFTTGGAGNGVLGGAGTAGSTPSQAPPGCGGMGGSGGGGTFGGVAAGTSGVGGAGGAGGAGGNGLTRLQFIA